MADDAPVPPRRSLLQALLAVPLTLASPRRAHALLAPRAPRHVLLDEFRVAGLRFHDGARVVGGLAPGSVLTLRAEPANRFDAFAVEILLGETKLGYVPRACNRHISRLLREGVALRCEVEHSDARAAPWDVVVARVLLVTNAVA